MSPSPAALNDRQLEAVSHGGGPLLVLAGPGSGKTRVVTHRIARLLASGVPAASILAVTFTNKAAREMRERVRSLAGTRAKGLVVSTIHSACLRILRREAESLGYGVNFSIYDEGSQASLARSVLRDMGGAGATRSPSIVLDGVGRAKGGGGATGDGDGERERFVALAVERYREELFARNAVDFDDIILLTARVLRENADVAARWRARWQWLLVDEYQDTNPAQDEVLSILAAEHRNLFVVGDDDQSVYGWRGAEVEHVLTFPRRFPDARVVKLEQNYRSTGRIVALANSVAAELGRRHPKTLFTEAGHGDAVRVVELPDETEEAEFIAHEIAAAIQAPGVDAWKAAGRHAVLFRTNEQMRPLEQALRQARVPYRLLGGRSFFDRKEVLDLVAYLRLVANPADQEALFRIVNVPSRGLGAKTLQSLRAEAGRRRVSTWTVVRDVALTGAGDATARRGASALRSLVSSVERVGRLAAGVSPRLVDELVADIGYGEEVERTYQDVKVRAARLALVEEVQQSWTDYLAEAEQPSLGDFLDGLALRDHDDDRASGGGVTLATVHAAKGLEFASVHVAGLEDGAFPHARSLEDGRALEEERRVFYVAVTRAKQRLTLTRAASRMFRGKSVRRTPSRFLCGLPEDCVEVTDTSAPASEDAVQGHLSRMRAALRPPEE